MIPPAYLKQCLANKELVHHFDRLNGTNLSRVGSVMELMVDDSSGRSASDMNKFVEFLEKYIFAPITSQE